MTLTAMTFPRTRVLIAALLLALSLVASLPSLAEDEALAGLDWLTGRWVEEQDDGSVIEVIWSKRVGDSMVGTWRVVKNGELRAYEILTMRHTEEGVFYRFDLFRKTSDFSKQGETIFKLNSIDGQHAEFDLIGSSGRLTIEISDEGRLTGAWSDPEKPDEPPVIGYDAARAK